MPNTKAEDKLAIKELRLRKKELSIHRQGIKRTLAAERASFRQVRDQTKHDRKFGSGIIKAARAEWKHSRAEVDTNNRVAQLQTQIANLTGEITTIEYKIIALERGILTKGQK